MSEFYGLKLKSGETLLTEVISDSGETLHIKEPIAVKQQISDQGMELLVYPFADYALDRDHFLQRSHIYMMDKMSPEYIKYYGKAIMSMKISKIKNDMYEYFVGDINEDYYRLVEMLDKINAASKYYIEKFNVDAPDFSDLEAKLFKHRPTLQ